MRKETCNINFDNNTSEVWRLIKTLDTPATIQMALDQVLLESVGNRACPPTIRFLSFSRPTVLIGYHQDLASEVRLSHCQEKGYDINRRLTGGGALFWGKAELGWELFMPRDHPALPAKIAEVYRQFCSFAAAGLSNLGIECRFRPRNDLVVDGRKISGTGAVSAHRAMLFQGTVLVDYDIEEMLRALRIPTEKLKNKEIASVKDRLTDMKASLGHIPSTEEMISALTEAFCTGLGIGVLPGELTASERLRLNQLEPVYRSSKHVDPVHRRRPAYSLYSAVKTPGGIIRINVKTAANARTVSQAIITGDFLVEDTQVIYDLEAVLKQTSIDRESLGKRIREFFSANGTGLVRVKPEHFAGLFVGLADKISDRRLPLTLHERNFIFPACGSLEEFKGVSHVLLPYCAKKPSCRWRRTQGCDDCGGCGYGAAARLAKESGLEPITVLSYEHLCRVLAHLAKKQSPGYIGCCCESFFIKHGERFKRADTPGMLIDIEQSTCFDLGKQHEAELGLFENHTQLRLDLLERVIKAYV